MSIDFHAPENRQTYASRDAHPDWASAIRALLEPAGKHVADIGCGGGIYSAAWADLGAARVVGVDSSAQMVQAAAEKNAGKHRLTFHHGDATTTGLPPASFNVVFARALIHHLADYGACFHEAARLLASGGHYIIQDRTPDDVRLPGTPDHPRGYFFECFPRLLDIEIGRRPTAAKVESALRRAGFDLIGTTTLWETRAEYGDIANLKRDLMGRTGRSILHELNDAELTQLVEFIATRMTSRGRIVEKDRWTIWHARKL